MLQFICFINEVQKVIVVNYVTFDLRHEKYKPDRNLKTVFYEQ